MALARGMPLTLSGDGDHTRRPSGVTPDALSELREEAGPGWTRFRVPQEAMGWL